jgi:hypothetical protein
MTSSKKEDSHSTRSPSQHLRSRKISSEKSQNNKDPKDGKIQEQRVTNDNAAATGKSQNNEDPEERVTKDNVVTTGSPFLLA